MADLKIDKKKEKDLQAALIAAVFHGYSDVVKEAGEALNEYFKKYESPKAKKSKRSAASEEPRPKTTGPQMLDFLVECCYDSKTKTWREIPAKCRSEYRRRSPLMIALQEGKIDVARQLIQLEASVAFKNKNGMTALHIACSKGQTEMVELILETAKQQNRFCYKKGDKKKSLNSDYEVILNARGPKGWTALMFAVHHGRLNTVKKLMECDILDYGKKTRKQQTVFQVAAKAGTLECLKEVATKSTPELMLATNKKDWNVFHQACSNGNLELLQWLLQWLQANMPVDQQAQHLNQKTMNGYTPLLVACLYHKLELVRCLTDKSLVTPGLVDIAACCHEDGRGRGSNGLHLAAETYAAEVAKVLIKAGCPLEQQDKEGNTVLHVANRRGSYSVATLITQVDKDLATRKNNDGKLPSEMLEEIVIPLEIKKRGEEAIEIYMKALNEGKTKIPRCSLLILGKQKVGKTSLYRQLVGDEFKDDLDSTRGINNNVVEIVDKRNINTKTWHEEKDPDTGQQFGDRLGVEVVSTLPAKTEEARVERVFGSEELMTLILRTIREIKDEIERSRRPLVNMPMPRAPPQATPAPWLGYGYTPSTSADSAPPLKRVRVQVSEPPPPAPQPPPPPAQPPPENVEVPKPVSQPKPKPPPVAPVRQKPTPPPPPPPEEETNTPIVSEESEEEIEPSQPQGVLTRRQSARFDELLRGKRQVEETSLKLNSFDFAGQPHYRPMHHCYIARRALYLVVFNIEEMLEHISEKPCKPIEDIRYWIQSINAHIYPPDDKREDDKKINRVFLVGTHRGVWGKGTEEMLKRVDNLIRLELIRRPESKSINHVCPVAGSSDNGSSFFIAVENSIDCTKGNDYLKDSGINLLQEKLEEVSGKIEFTKEEHPIKWLKFEERLEHCCKQRKPPVMSVQDVKQLAVSSRITEEDEQELALRFFHDTGKIIYLKYLSRLFLSDEQCEELLNLVVLSPDWLISVMRVIMELSTEHEVEGLKQDQILQLESKGIADLELLSVCWKKFLSASDSASINVHHLCWILQAHCLIYPVTIDNDSKYIIPCKLPKTLEEECSLPNSSTFVFDFKGFLLEEIYHRLICLVSRDAKRLPRSKNLYSHKKCKFLKFLDTNWIMEMDSEKHKLIFRVIAKRSKPGHEYIKEIHDYLHRICKESHLEGLVYYGGVEVNCKVCKDITLAHCVTFDDGKTSITCNLECLECTTDYNVDDFFVGNGSGSAASPPCNLPSDSASKIEQTEQYLHEGDLDIDDKRAVAVFLGTLATEWKVIGLMLGIKDHDLQTIEKDNKGCKAQLLAMITLWLTGKGGKRTWSFLCQTLRQDFVGKPLVAEKIEKKLRAPAH